MYKDVVKRVIAVILTICMIGGMPDYSLMAQVDLSDAGGMVHTYMNHTTEDGEVLKLGTSGTISAGYTVSANNSSQKNSQTLTDISFALDYSRHNGDTTIYADEADYTVEVYANTTSGTGGTKVGSATGKYRAGECEGEYFKVSLSGKAVDGGDIVFAEGENFRVDVSLSNAKLIDDNNQPVADDNIYYKVADGSGRSYVNGTRSTGKVVCVNAYTEESSQDIEILDLAAEDGTLYVTEGGTVDAHLVYTPDNTTQREVEWSSASKSVATVNENGQITGVNQGYTTISAVSAVAGKEDLKAEFGVYVCRDMNGGDIVVSPSTIGNQIFTGTAKRPTFSVKDGEKSLVVGSEYAVDYSNNVNAGVGVITITGIKENGYMGQRILNFNINPLPMNSEKLEITCQNHSALDGLFSIDSISGVAVIDEENPANDLTLVYHTDEGDVALTYGKDYELKKVDGKTVYGNNDKTGNSAYVVLTGKGNYDGEVNARFGIRKEIDNPEITAAFKSGTSSTGYTGEAFRPEVVVKDKEEVLTEDVDYRVTYIATKKPDGTPVSEIEKTDLASAGTKQAIITGLGAYASKDDMGQDKVKILEYSISPKLIGSAGITVSVPQQIKGFTEDTVQGLSVKYNKITLVKDVDFTLTVEDADLDEARIILTGIGNYSGSKTLTVKTGTSINDAGITITHSLSEVFTGREITPEVVVKDGATILSENSDYTVEYKNNVNAHEASGDDAPTITITGIGGYAGIVEKHFEITQKDIATLPDSAFIYEDSVIYEKNKESNEVESPISIKYGTVTLKQGVDGDYTVAYANHSDVTDAAKITITAVAGGNYTGTKELTYEITAKNITASNITVEYDEEELVYTGSGVKLKNLKLYHNGYEMQEGSDDVNVADGDYYVNYILNTNSSENQDAQAIVQIRGKGNYKATREFTFEIGKYDISKTTAAAIAAQEYTGSAIKPAVPTITQNYTDETGDHTRTLTSEDYDVVYVDNIEAGEAQIILTGKGNYKGTKIIKFAIYKDLSAASGDTVTIAPISDQGYTGQILTPSVTVTDARESEGTPHILILNTDYTVSYGDSSTNVNVGDTGTVTITGKGNYYKGSKTVTFRIVPGNLSDAVVTLGNEKPTFTGSGIEPSVTVTYQGATLPVSEYDVYYSNNVHVSTVDKKASVIIQGKNNFAGKTITKTFSIQPKSIESTGIEATLTNPDEEYDLENHPPVYRLNDKYRNTDGDYKADGTGRYVLAQYISDGVPERADYKITYEEDDVANGMIAVITGMGDYTGEIRKTFQISAKSIADAVVKLVSPDCYYTGEEVYPSIMVSVNNHILDKEDYKIRLVSGADNINANTYLKIGFYVDGCGAYAGTVGGSNPTKFYYTIHPRDMADVVVADIPNQKLVNGVAKPEVEVSFNNIALVKNEDYRITGYGNNTSYNIGSDSPKPYVLIEGIGNFSGTRKVEFNIRPTLEDATIELPSGKQVYTSEEIRPLPTVTLGSKVLQDGVDYILKYRDNVDSTFVSKKKAAVIVEGTGEYSGSRELSFEIERVDVDEALANGTMVINSKSNRFTGSAIKPSVEILYQPSSRIQYTLKDGNVDYDVQGQIGTFVGAEIDTTIYPCGNFYSANNAVSYRYTIREKEFTDTEAEGDILVTGIEDMKYTGSTLKPNVKLYDIKRMVTTGEARDTAGTETDSYRLEEEKDYTVEYEGSLSQPGRVTVRFTGKGNYENSVIAKYFTISGTFTADDFTIDSPVYTGKTVKPKVTAKNSSLVEGIDFTVEVFNAVDCNDKSYVVISGKGMYEGTEVTKYFNIQQKDMSDLSVPKLGTFTYGDVTTDDIKERITVIYGKLVLTQDTDYVCEFPYESESENLEYRAEAYTVTLKAKADGNYKGQAKVDYVIGTNFNVTVTYDRSKTYTYTGKTVVPDELKVVEKGTNKVLEFGEEYLITISEGDPTYINVDKGQKFFNVYGIGAYAGHVTCSYTMVKKNLADEDIEVEAIAPSVPYTGEAYTPTPDVTWNGRMLEETTDFEYKHSNNVDAGTATLEILPGENNNFTGKKTISYTIEGIDLTKEMDFAVGTIDEQSYTGKEIKPVPQVKVLGQMLTEGTDYTVTYTNNVEVGTAYVNIHGKGNYSGTVERAQSFEIIPRDISLVNRNYQTVVVYTGQKIMPEVELRDGGVVLQEGKDYLVSYPEIGNTTCAENGQIYIAGMGNYIGNLTEGFIIEKRDLKDATISVKDIPPQVIRKDGTVSEPEVEISMNLPDGFSYQLKKDVDYSVEYTTDLISEQKTGKATISADAISGGNFKGILEKDYEIGSDIADYIDSVAFTADWTDKVANLKYDGQEHKPEVKVVSGLVEGKDYKIIYDDDTISAGVHKVSVQGCMPYGGTVDLEYTIGKRELSKVSFALKDLAYTAAPLTQEVVGVDDEATTMLFAGSEITAEVKEGYQVNRNAFTAQFENNVDVGMAVVRITAAEEGNYTGEVVQNFAITPKDITDASIVVAPIESKIYTGESIVCEPVLFDTARKKDGSAKIVGTKEEDYTLVYGTDYTIVSFENNVNPGIAKITVEGKGNYWGRQFVEFEIKGDLSMAEIDKIPVQKYTGLPVMPELNVSFGDLKLVAGIDYAVTYQNNIERGTAYATITALNSLYTGTKTVEFFISREVNNATVRMITDTFTYTGEEIRPEVSVEYDGEVLKKGEDYEVSYQNNINAGKATVIVTGTGAYSGETSMEFMIIRRNVTRCSYGNIQSKAFNGKPTTQELVVTDGQKVLLEGTDYTLEYVNNTKPGVATITVTGIGNYGGTKTIRYNIEVKDMTIVYVSSGQRAIKLKWNAVDGATGYAIYNSKNRLIAKTTSRTYTHKNLKDATKYSYKVRPYVISDGATYFGGFSNLVSATTYPAVPVYSKIVFSKSSVQLKWKKISKADGYEVYRSTKKSGGYKKLKTIKGNKQISYTDKKVKAKKTYYYKIRSYRTVGSVKMYSQYSSVKKVTIN